MNVIMSAALATESMPSIEGVAQVDREKLVKDALDLINIDSPTGREGEVGEEYASKLRALGMKVVLQEVEQGRQNVLATLRGANPRGATLMFNGHLDTSFAASESPDVLRAISPVYRFEPPWGYLKGDWIYGMGAFNMKSALAAYLAAVRALQDSGFTAGGDIVIAGVVGEIEKTQVDNYQSRFTYQGVKPTVNIGSIEGGWPWRASRTPGYCNLYVDVRFPPPHHPLEIKQEMAKALEAVSREHKISPELDLYVTDQWSEVSPDEYVCRSVGDAHRQVIGEKVETVYFSWSSDANILTRHGIAAVNYGPSGGLGKETRGTMYIPNLVSCAKVYALVARDISSKTRDEVRKK